MQSRSIRLHQLLPSNAFCSLAVLKQVHPDTGISNRAMSILNSFVNGMFFPIQICKSNISSIMYSNLRFFRHFRACCDWGLQACCLQQEVNHFFSRDPDLGPSHPPRWTRQARCLWGHQGRHQVLFFHEINGSLNQRAKKRGENKWFCFRILDLVFGHQQPGRNNFCLGCLMIDRSFRSLLC